MKKNIPTPLTDEYLQSLHTMKEAETDPFFYTRLKARMEMKTGNENRDMRVKPAWLLSLLVIFLFINTFFLITQFKDKKEATSQNISLQNFANSYNLTVSTSF